MEYILTHHGVKGMKWGVRKVRRDFGTSGALGGPYEENRRASEGLRAKHIPTGQPTKLTKAMGRINKNTKITTSARQVNQTDDPDRKAKQERVKRAVKVGATAAGTALAVYGTYKMSRALKDKAYSAALERGSKAIYKYTDKRYMQDVRPRITDKAFRDLNGGKDFYNLLDGHNNLHSRLAEENLRYAERASRNTVAAVKELLGKNYELPVATLLDMGIKVHGY